MKRRLIVLMTMALLVLQINTVFAQDISAFNQQPLTSGSALEVQLIGRIDASIISVIIPTQVKFAVIPEAEGWNKVLSPDFTVRNVGNIMLDVSITQSSANTPDVELTAGTPTYNGANRQVRLAVAPKADYPSVVRVRDYLLTGEVSDSNSVFLTKGLDYNPLNDSATYNIYGDISSGWSNNEEFSVAVVFKVSM